MNVNVGCGPHRAPRPWVNLDVVSGGGIDPDHVVSDAMRPLADFVADSVGRVYLGHVLEHVRWDDVPDFLVALLPAIRAGGQIAAVGPDVERIIQRWCQGFESWELVEAAMEGPWSRDFLTSGHTLRRGEAPRLASRHEWNCTMARMVLAFNLAGLEVRTTDVGWLASAGWPVVDHSVWQCSVIAEAP